jgi:hypothetical protein
MVAPWQAVGQTACLARIPVWGDIRFLLATVALVALLLLGALVIWLADRWRKRPASRESAGDQLAHFRRLYERGEISAEEFIRIRDLLTARLMKELEPPPPESPPGPQPPKPNGPAT